MPPARPAFRRPGPAARRTSSAVLSGQARLWFTIGFGIVNEVYYPRVDIPQIRDLGFIVAGPDGFWSEVKRNENYTLRLLAPGVPAVEIVHEHPRYTLRLRVTPDPRRDVLVVACQLAPAGDGRRSRPLRSRGAASRRDRLRQCRDGRTLPIAPRADGRAGPVRDGARRGRSASARCISASQRRLCRQQRRLAGFRAQRRDDLAISDRRAGQCRADGRIAAAVRAWRWASGAAPNPPRHWPYRALFSHSPISCNSRSRSGNAGSRAAANTASRCWTCRRQSREQARVSAIVLRSHLDKTYPGAMVASLSVPWGHTGNQRGGYHLVWPRDLVECAGALLALGADAEARDTLRYLIATQNEDGHWNQNQWLGGTPYWQGLQLDETALPVLLATALDERDALRGIEVEDMVRRALGYIARTGPSTGPGPLGGERGHQRLHARRVHRRAGRRGGAAAGTGMPTGRWRSPISGTSRSRPGRRSAAPSWPGNTIFRAITSASRRPASSPRPAPAPRSCRSATGAATAGCAATSRSAPNSCSSCASGCAAPTTR